MKISEDTLINSPFCHTYEHCKAKSSENIKLSKSKHESTGINQNKQDYRTKH
jgi:hypothetical protein